MNRDKKNMSKKFILFVGLFVIGSLLFITGCPAVATDDGETVKGNTSTENSETASNESPIAKVDFKNFSYPLNMEAVDEKDKNLTLKDGKSEKSENSNAAEIGKVQYADLTGDKVDEAIVDVILTGEKDSKSNMIYVYTLEDEKPKLLWNFETKSGEKIGLKTISADNGKLLVEMFGNAEFVDGKWKMTESKEKAIENFTKTEFKWDGEKFVLEGKPEVVEANSKA